MTPTPSDTVILVGTGALNEPWAPIYRALREKIAPQCPSEPDIANLQMARLVHLLRFFHGRNPKQERVLQSNLRELRIAIARHLWVAQDNGTLTLRTLFVDYLTAVINSKVSPGKFHIVTTNWDTTIDDMASKRWPNANVVHLHGSISSPNTLYLPSEMSVEQYKHNSESKHLASAFQQSIRAVECSAHLIIYGLSLSPLDAEVCQVLWAGRKGAAALERITIVDTVPEPVALRLAAVLDPEGLPPTGITQRIPS